MSFANGPGHGLDGLRAQHREDMSSFSAGGRITEKVGQMLLLLQLIWCTPCGADAIVHALRSNIKSTIEPGVILKFDLRDVFNSLNWDVMLDMIKNNVPEPFRYFQMIYSTATPLLYENQVIRSEKNVQKGDSIGPIGFGPGSKPDNTLSPMHI